MKTESKSHDLKFTIVNVVVTASLGQRCTLERLAGMHGFSYDTVVYHSAYFKDEATTGKVIIFATGKMISVGTKSFEAASRDLERAADKLATVGLTSRVPITAKTQNMVATADLERSINLDRLAIAVPGVVYDPEGFPGAIWHPSALPELTLLLFSNGKLVCVGLKQLGSLKRAKAIVRDLLAAL